MYNKPISLLDYINKQYQKQIDIIIDSHLKKQLAEIDCQMYGPDATITSIIKYPYQKKIIISVNLDRNKKHLITYELELEHDKLIYKDQFHQNKNISFKNILEEFKRKNTVILENDKIKIESNGFYITIQINELQIIYDFLTKEIIGIKPDILSSNACYDILKKLIVYQDENGENKIIINEAIEPDDYFNFKKENQPKRSDYQLNYHHYEVRLIKPDIANIHLGKVEVIYNTENNHIINIIPNIVSEESCIERMIEKGILKIPKEENYQRRRVKQNEL